MRITRTLVLRWPARSRSWWPPTSRSIRSICIGSWGRAAWRPGSACCRPLSSWPSPHLQEGIRSRPRAAATGRRRQHRLLRQVFGAASGVELFLLPCALLGTVLFRPDERLKSAIVVALPFIAYLFVDAHLGEPVMMTSSMRGSSPERMSVAALIALIGLLCSTLLATREVEIVTTEVPGARQHVDISD